jgi:hypothetical protein
VLRSLLTKRSWLSYGMKRGCEFSNFLVLIDVFSCSTSMVHLILYWQRSGCLISLPLIWLVFGNLALLLLVMVVSSQKCTAMWPQRCGHRVLLRVCSWAAIENVVESFIGGRPNVSILEFAILTQILVVNVVYCTICRLECRMQPKRPFTPKWEMVIGPQ